MDKWNGKVALVTGGNSGIGLAITKMLLGHGMVVVAVDKFVDNLKLLFESDGLAENNNCVTPDQLHILARDVSCENDVEDVFSWCLRELQGPDVLVNSAGIAGSTSLLDGTADEWRRLVDVNIIGLGLCTREAVRSMKIRNTDLGQIINLCSNLTYHVPREGILHFYAATKHAVKSLTSGFQVELLGTPIKISSISPGLVKTGIFKASLGEAADRAVYSKMPYMSPEDVASAVQYILTVPKQLQVAEMNIKPLGSLF